MFVDVADRSPLFFDYLREGNGRFLAHRFARAADFRVQFINLL
jgi:hypothetical protein